MQSRGCALSLGASWSLKPPLPNVPETSDSLTAAPRQEQPPRAFDELGLLALYAFGAAWGSAQRPDLPCLGSRGAAGMPGMPALHAAAAEDARGRPPSPRALAR